MAGPDMPMETHGLRIKQLETLADSLRSRVHEVENKAFGLVLHANEQKERNEDVEDRLRKVEQSTLKNGLILVLIGSIAGIGGSWLLNHLFH